MTWQLVIQSFMMTFAAIGGWFLYDLVREFKSFKSETKNDVFTLKQERHDFKTTVRNAELTISLKVNDLTRLHHDFSIQVRRDLQDITHEVAQIKKASTEAAAQTENYGEFLKSTLKLSRAFNERLKAQESELKTLKVELGQALLMLKNRKG